MQRVMRNKWFMGLSIFLVVQAVGVLAQTGSSANRRAQRPEFDARTSRVFFPDVFSKLVGSRPNDLSASAPPAATAAIPQPGGDESPAAGGNGEWDALISATTLEDEVKKLKIAVDRDVTTPSDFAGRGYKECRVHFTTLAAMFGVIHQYKDDVRWKKSARSARDSFARTAANAKVGTPQVYNEAKLRKQDLQDLISGGALDIPAKPEPPSWGELIDRAPLMQRLEVSVNGQLKSMLSSESEFKSNTEDIFHQAEVVAVLSELLTKEGMEDGDDKDYAAYAKRMRDAAREIVEGVKLNDYERARKAIGAVDQSCTECHEFYRA